MGKAELTGRQRTFNDTFYRNRWSIGEKKKPQLGAFSLCESISLLVL